jgi:hypothetical protein
MIQVQMTEQEWSQVISAIAAAHPLIQKISTQVVAQKGFANAVKGNGVGSHPRTDALRESSPQSPANSGYSAEQREEGPIKTSSAWPPKPE